MIEHRCTVAHKPDAGSYGDCFRACVASILDIEDIESVPNFAAGGADWYADFVDWCYRRNIAAITFGIDGNEPIEAVGAFMSGHNRYAIYILIGDTADGTHCAIYRAGGLLHDPAWFPIPIIKAPAGGDWQIVVLASAVVEH